MRSTLARTALGGAATVALAGTLVSCASANDQGAASPSSTEAASSAPATTNGSPAIGPTDPASSADQAEMTAVFQRYVDTSNSGDSQAYLATICSTDPVHSQDLTDRDPAQYPVTLENITDFTVDGNDGLATVTVKIGLEDKADRITERFTFVRESGAWTVCGEQQDQTGPTGEPR